MRALLLIAILLPSTLTAQTVYKCTVNGQTAYQQQPCDDNARAEQLEFKARKEDTVGTDAYVRMSRNVKLADIENAQQQCISNARDRIYSQANRRIAGLDAQIVRLRQRITVAANNMAGASWEAGMRSEIAGLEQAIATERTSADGLFMDAEQRCIETAEKSVTSAREQFAREDEQRAAQRSSADSQ